MRCHTMLELVGVCCGLWGMVSPVSAVPAVNTNVPQVIPQAIVPFLATPPHINGTIDPKEWPTLHVSHFVSQQGDLLQAKPGEFWIGCDGKRLYIAVRSAVHPQAGILAVNHPHGDADIGEVVYDDSIELWIDNNPGGNTGQYYQIMVNSNGAIYDASFERKDKIAQKFWRVKMEQAHIVKDGIWNAEFAIDLSSLNITNPEQQLAMRVCRNFKYPWDQSRWAPLVRAFDTPDTMPKIRFSRQAPVVTELGFQNTQGIDIGVEISNPTPAPFPLHVKIGGNAQDQPRYFHDWDITLATGERRSVAYQTPFFTAGNYPALGEILITGTAGQEYYHRDVKWQTSPTKVWDVVASANVDEAVQFNIAFLPTSRTLRWQAAFAGWKEKTAMQRVRVEVQQEDGKQIAVDNQEVSKEWTAAGTLAMANLTPGKYHVRAFFDGPIPAAAPLKTTTFQYATDFPWLHNTLGISDEVIPPFTPLKVTGHAVDAVLRRHQLDATGLWSQVQSLGEPLLSAPMSFIVRQGGKTQPVHGKLTFTEKRPNRVTAESHWRAGSVEGHTTSEMDMDGCMKVTLELSQHDRTPVDALELAIPLRADQVSLMHVCGEGLRSNYGGAVPAGTGVVWESKYASRDKLLGTFIPYLFVGGPERGLVWFASNDRDWVLDPADAVSALALERRGDTVLLHVRLVQASTTFTRTHRIVFGLQATPVKPMPTDPDWRVWGVSSGGKFDALLLGMCMYWGGHLYDVAPLGRDYTIVQKIAQAKKEGKRDDAFFTAYMLAHPEIKNEINWSAAPAKVAAVIPYTNVRGENMAVPEWPVYQDEWRRHDFTWRVEAAKDQPLDFDITLPRSRQDYLLYAYREFLRNGFDGIYWDNICLYDNENPATGNGYRRADGQFQPDTDIWELRELTRRTAMLFHQLGKRNLTMPHMTNAYLIPVFSWTTINFDWEWKYGGSDFQDRFTRDYIRAASLGRQGGNVPVVLSGITEVSDPVQRAWVERTRAGVCLTHELAVYQADPFYTRIRQHLFVHGYGTEACRVYHYWDAQPVVTVDGLDATWIACRRKDTVTLILTDYGNGGNATVRLDTRMLGLPTDFAVVNWETPAITYSAHAGVFTCPGIAKHDLRVFTITRARP